MRDILWLRLWGYSGKVGMIKGNIMEIDYNIMVIEYGIWES